MLIRYRGLVFTIYPCRPLLAIDPGITFFSFPPYLLARIADFHQLDLVCGPACVRVCMRACLGLRARMSACVPSTVV